MEHQNIAKNLIDSFEKEAIDVYLFKNGQQDAPPRKYHLSQDDLIFWNKTLKSVAETQNEIGKPLELYKLDGQKISGPLELQHGAAYVVVKSNENFQDSGYRAYMLQASRSMEKRFKQTNHHNYGSTATAAPTTNKAKKFKKVKIMNLAQPERKLTENKNKTTNESQIRTVSHTRIWPGKRKEEGNPQRGSRPLSPVTRRSSPVKRSKLQKRDSSVSNILKTEKSKEMVALNKKEGSIKGIQGYNNNVGHLLDIFRDMNIKYNLENENPRLLVLLNEKKVATKVDAGMQVLVVQLDESTDPPINLVDYDDKGVQKPSKTSVFHNYDKESYVALMQPGGSLQVTMKTPHNSDGIKTEISEQKNVEILKLDDNLKDDRVAEFCVNTSLADKVFIETKIIRIIALRYVNNDIKIEDKRDSFASPSLSKMATITPNENQVTGLIHENHREEMARNPNMPNIQEYPREEMGRNPYMPNIQEHSFEFDHESISKKSSNATIAETKPYPNNLHTFKTIQTTENHEDKVTLSIGKSLNEIETTTKGDIKETEDIINSEFMENMASQTQGPSLKAHRRVSMCVTEKDDTSTSQFSRHISVDEDGNPIVLLEARSHPIDSMSRKFSVTVDNLPKELDDNTMSNLHILTHQGKNTNVLDVNTTSRPGLNDGTLSSAQLISNKETNTPDRSQVGEKDPAIIDSLNQPTVKDLSNYTKLNGIAQTSPTVDRQCDVCSVHPPPCAPSCTPIVNMSASTSLADLASCVCHGPSNKPCEYIQTDSCEVLLMVRRHLEDSQYSFHFPTIKDLKDYKLI